MELVEKGKIRHCGNDGTKIISTITSTELEKSSDIFNRYFFKKFHSLWVVKQCISSISKTPPIPL